MSVSFLLDIDECTSNVAQCHKNLTKCVNTPGGYRCECVAESTGDDTTCECKSFVGESNIAQCHKNLKKCVNTPGGYRCECVAESTGNDTICECKSFIGNLM